MAEVTPITVAILWHMHQPNYREPHTNRLAMPWVRLHALKDYLDMPLTAASHEGVRVTFNLVPSLIDQLNHYLSGGTDSHLDLSRVSADQLSRDRKLELLETFFSANPGRMINPFPRYRELYKKFKSGASERGALASLFSSGEVRDLQVWSNLVWVDPMFRGEAPIKELFEKGRHFTEEEKHSLLDWQLKLIGRIVSTYRDLQDTGRIEVSFTPYYHPILPLLCDTNIATEALPSIALPQKRFVHPQDARHQISMSAELYRQIFGKEMVGMWPSEGSVSEDVLRMMAEMGVQWAASDQEILTHSLEKSGMDRYSNAVHRVYEYAGVKLLFRDHALSDRIGFVYSTWDADRAVADFMGHLKRLRSIYAGSLERTVIPIILDGENAWEYFPEDATEFLNLFYEQLDREPEVRTVTVGDAVNGLPATKLPSLFAGSWINHNFRIWIGHEEDNAAWDLLSRTRDTLEEFERSHQDFDPEKLKKAWNQIYIAEGSDWCWWYGDEHRGDHNEQFDRIFRQHLIAVYELIGLDIPIELLKPIHGGVISSFTIPPDSLVTPSIDGLVTHFYEWSGAGYFDCRKAGGAMHQVERQITGIHFAYDKDRLYIRLDLRSKKDLELLTGLKLQVTFFVPEPQSVELSLARTDSEKAMPSHCRIAADEIIELAIDRDHLWPAGHGALSFNVALLQNNQKLESWPENEPIELEVQPRDQELFWKS